MRFLRGLIWFVLVVSMAANVLVWKRYHSGRTIMSVGGQAITKKDMDDYLELQHGADYRAMCVERLLTDQEAARQNVVPTQKEIDDAFNNLKEIDWQFAQRLAARPWTESETRAEIRQKLEQDRLVTKDIPVTDEEISEEYQGVLPNGARRSALYDTPDKAHVELAVVFNEARAADVVQLLQQNDPPVSPTAIMQQFSDEVAFLGDKSVYTFVQPFGDSSNRTIASVFALKPGDVKRLPPEEFRAQGAKAVVIRLIDIVPGHRADLNAPEVREKIRIAVAKKRSKPWHEFLSPIWDRSPFESDVPNDRQNIERVLFPERTNN